MKMKKIAAVAAAALLTAQMSAMAVSADGYYYNGVYVGDAVSVADSNHQYPATIGGLVRYFSTAAEQSRAINLANGGYYYNNGYYNGSYYSGYNINDYRTTPQSGYTYGVVINGYTRYYPSQAAANAAFNYAYGYNNGYYNGYVNYNNGYYYNGYVYYGESSNTSQNGRFPYYANGRYWSNRVAASSASSNVDMSYVTSYNPYYPYYSSTTQRYYHTREAALLASNGNAAAVSESASHYYGGYYYNGYYPYTYYNWYYGNYSGYDPNYYAYLAFRNKTSDNEVAATKGTPYITSSKSYAGWSTIVNLAKKAKAGQGLDITLNGSSVVPKELLTAVKGRNVGLRFELDNGSYWTINGRNIETAKELNVSIEYNIDYVPSKLKANAKKGALAGYQLGITNGFDELGLKAMISVKLNQSRAGKTAYVYVYNKDSNTLNGVYKNTIEKDGTCSFNISDGGAYYIVVK